MSYVKVLDNGAVLRMSGGSYRRRTDRLNRIFQPNYSDKKKAQVYNILSGDYGIVDLKPLGHSCLENDGN